MDGESELADEFSLGNRFVHWGNQGRTFIHKTSIFFKKQSANGMRLGSDLNFNSCLHNFMHKGIVLRRFVWVEGVEFQHLLGP